MNILHQKPLGKFWIVSGMAWWLGLSGVVGFAQEEVAQLGGQAREAMQRAATFYSTQVARHGGYVYHYDLDLHRSWGEGEASRDQIWVQPPGTPTVGLAYLAAFRATGDLIYLKAATSAAEALCYGQLKSGGWTNCIDFNPRGERVALYRNGRGGGKNNSSLDDGQTQMALLFLIRADAAHGFQHAAIHQAVEVGMASLLAAQFSCGAFPQVWDGPRTATALAAEQNSPHANFPTYDWRTEGKVKEYWTLYTLNDGLAESVAETLRTAFEVYGDKKYRTAWHRLGDFLILAQMPAPQPAWAQQYNFDMQPVWARRFEPPAISGLESQGVLRVLIDLYRDTHQEKYLRPIPAALEYLRRSRLNDGRLARYYELQTNRPLYMQRQGNDYSLSYDDSNLPDHYGWKVEADVEVLQQAYDAARHPPSEKLRVEGVEKQDAAAVLQRVRELIAALDQQGRWVSESQGERLVGQLVFPKGTHYLSSAVFSHNLTELAAFVSPTP